MKPRSGNVPQTAFPLEAMIGEVVDRVSARDAEVQDRDSRWYSLQIRPYMTLDKRIDGAVLTLSDITERKSIEVLLRDADHRKDEFLATLAHELRNPLAPILNAAQILQKSPENALSVQEASEVMLRQTRHMMRLIDDLLDASRITLDRIELRRGRIDIATTIRQTIEAARAAERTDRQFALSLPAEPVFVNADAVRLTQIIGNLLSNARKFTGSAGRIDVSVVRQDDYVCIRVRDDGIGMAPDQVPRIFEMFTQLDTSLERPTTGLGIGLALAKRLVTMHGGTIDAESAGENRGSEFVVRLPVLDDAAHPQPQLSHSVDVREMSGRRILIADDNHDSATTLAALLELSGNMTHVAHDGFDAVQAAQSFQPEVALLDIGMPQLNGYEAARRIREQPWGKDILLIAVTGWGQKEDIMKAKDAGFDHHLTKPADFATIARLVATSPTSSKR